MKQGRGVDISQEQFLGAGPCAGLQRQRGFDAHTLLLCHLANVCDEVEEPGTKSESFTIQDPKEDFTDFLQRLISGVNRIMSDFRSQTSIN